MKNIASMMYKTPILNEEEATKLEEEKNKNYEKVFSEFEEVVGPFFEHLDDIIYGEYCFDDEDSGDSGDSDDSDDDYQESRKDNRANTSPGIRKRDSKYKLTGEDKKNFLDVTGMHQSNTDRNKEPIQNNFFGGYSKKSNKGKKSRNTQKKVHTVVVDCLVFFIDERFIELPFEKLKQFSKIKVKSRDFS